VVEVKAVDLNAVGVDLIPTETCMSHWWHHEDLRT